MKIVIAIAKTLLGIIAFPIIFWIGFTKHHVKPLIEFAHDLGDEVCQYLRGWVEK